MAEESGKAGGECAAWTPKWQAIGAAAVPFRAVEQQSAAASFLLPVRSTLVAPILPEPILRTSTKPGHAGQEQAERDGAEQIAEDDR